MREKRERKDLVRKIRRVGRSGPLRLSGPWCTLLPMATGCQAFPSNSLFSLLDHGMDHGLRSLDVQIFIYDINGVGREINTIKTIKPCRI